MSILVIGGIKGGSGKTTLATNLAVMRSCEKKVLLIDADDQRSTSDWVTQREALGIESKWATVQLTGSSIHSQLLKIKPDYDDIIIDVGGRDTKSQRSALIVADIFLIPFKPRSLDVWTIGLVVNLIEEIQSVNHSLKCYAVINQADFKGSDNEQAINLISSYPAIRCFPFTIGNRKSFANASSEGLSILELKNADKKSLEEIKILYDNIYR